MQNKSKLSSTKLEFELRVREFIDMILKDQHYEAVVYSRKNLAKFAEGNMDRFKLISGLIAFPKDKI